jgi:hypothetical protein
MYYLIYKVTNLINGKFYIGKHQTSNIDDGYMGSGKVLKKAIAKYGIENFQKEILCYCKDVNEMNSMEKELVVISESSYNLCPGGHGGFGYINSNPDKFLTEKRVGALITAGKKGNPAMVQKQKTDPEFKKTMDEHRRQARIKFKEKYPNGCWIGRSHSEDTKALMEQSHVGKHTGEKNSQYGSMWITNGTMNQKVKAVDIIPDGWRKGRVLKKT